MKKRITIICGAGIVSGKEIMALELGAGLKRMGHELRYIMSSWGSQRFADSAAEQGIPCEKMRLGFISATLTWDCIRMTLDQLWRLPWLWITFFLHLKRHRPQHIIHTNWHHLFVLWPFLDTKRDVYWIHEVVPPKRQYRWLLNNLSRRMNKLVTVSDAVKESIIALGVEPDRMEVIHNGISDPCPEGPPQRDLTIFRIGIVGLVERWKGHHVLIEALAALDQKAQSWELHVFGEGSTAYRQELEKRAAELGLGSKIVWHGRKSSKHDIYLHLDCCVVPVPAGENEALPTVAIEAAYFGIPVIASRRGGLPEIIESGQTGELVEAGDVSELSQALISLGRDQERRLKMGIAARAHAVTKFATSTFISKFSTAIEAVEPHS